MSFPATRFAPGDTPERDPDVQLLGKIVEILTVERKRRKMTLRQTGAASGYDWSYLARAERGLTQPGFVSLCKWCGALGLDFVTVAMKAKTALDDTGDSDS